MLVFNFYFAVCGWHQPIGDDCLKPCNVKFVDVLYFIINDLVSYLLEEYLQIAYKSDALCTVLFLLGSRSLPYMYVITYRSCSHSYDFLLFNIVKSHSFKSLYVYAVYCLFQHNL